MAIYSRRGPRIASASYGPETPMAGIDEHALQRIYGRAKEVNILTGEII